jgi:3-hydroxyisobutyrate dehydrogenase
MTDQIAFIGVGNMGNPMADQLVKAGKEVKVYDVSISIVEQSIIKQSFGIFFNIPLSPK